MKKIIVTGANGQDGSILINYLLNNTDYEVLGAVRRTSQAILNNLEESLKNPRFRLVPMELTDVHSITSLIKNEKPDFFINFAASSFVADSWNQPAFTMEANTISLIHILEAVRLYNPSCRVYSAGSSEEWGNVEYSPQDISHPKKPRSVYGVSKAAAGLICKVYRESYGIFVIHSILTNHESEARQKHFVTRKITSNVARIKYSIDNNIPFLPMELGNLDAKRDWSHSLDFVKGIWLMMNQEKPKEYILSSNETHSIREFVEKAFKVAGIQNILWDGEGVNEKLYFKDEKQQVHVLMTINPKFYRPAEVDLLLGDSTPARKELGWKPDISFDNLVKRMVEHDISET